MQSTTSNISLCRYAYMDTRFTQKMSSYDFSWFTKINHRTTQLCMQRNFFSLQNNLDLTNFPLGSWKEDSQSLVQGGVNSAWSIHLKGGYGFAHSLYVASLFIWVSDLFSLVLSKMAGEIWGRGKPRQRGKRVPWSPVGTCLCGWCLLRKDNPIPTPNFWLASAALWLMASWSIHSPLCLGIATSPALAGMEHCFCFCHIISPG